MSYFRILHLVNNFFTFLTSSLKIEYKLLQEFSRSWIPWVKRFGCQLYLLTLESALFFSWFRGKHVKWCCCCCCCVDVGCWRLCLIMLESALSFSWFLDIIFFTYCCCCCVADASDAFVAVVNVVVDTIVLLLLLFFGIWMRTKMLMMKWHFFFKKCSRRIFI